MNQELLNTLIHFGHFPRPETLHLNLIKPLRHKPRSRTEALLQSLAKAQEKARVQARLREVLALLKFEEHRGPRRVEPKADPTEEYSWEQISRKTHSPTHTAELVDSFTRTVGRLPQAEQDRAQALILKNFGLKPDSIEMELAEVKQKLAVLEQKVVDDYWPMEQLKSEVRGMRYDVSVQNKELNRLKTKLAKTEDQMMEARKENQKLKMENEELKRNTDPVFPNFDPAAFDMDTCDRENVEIEELMKSLGVAMEYMTMSDYGTLYQ